MRFFVVLSVFCLACAAQAVSDEDHQAGWMGREPQRVGNAQQANVQGHQRPTIEGILAELYAVDIDELVRAIQEEFEAIQAACRDYAPFQ